MAVTARIDALIAELLPVLGEQGVLTGKAVASRATGIWNNTPVAARVIFRPADTEQVAAVLRACHAAGQPVVTHGGLTGLVEGATASPAEVVLSTERLDRIEAINTADKTMVVQAGVRLQTAQEAAETNALLLPLDLGARGSCTLGGNAATNAGGNRVIRYGMTRDMVLGLEAVLADGTVVSSLNAMLKNNAGYDLKQLFIGSEGTLGIITRLVLRLRPLWQTQETALIACDDFEQATALLNHFERTLGGTLTAFELMWQNFYELMTADAQAAPLPGGHRYYVLVEALGDNPELDADRFQQSVAQALEQSLLANAVVCKSGAERDALWALRDNVEKTLEFGPARIFDVSLPLSAMEAYVQTVLSRLDIDCVGHQTWVFGHAGDGNLHLVCATGENAVETIERCVYEPLAAVGGSVSGEHGIGMEKKVWLGISRTPAEIALMQTLKRALDPDGILNPARITDA